MPSDKIFRTAFCFGSLNSSHYGPLVLHPTGEVRVYRNSNERNFRLSGADGNILEFYSDSRAITSRLKWHEDACAFLPLDNLRHYLLPLLTMEPLIPSRRTARIIVNTVPQSGTYLLEEVLTRLGYRSIHMHLNSEGLHDNRGIPPAEIHFDPGERFVPCPPRALAALLGPGEFAVGHIDSKAELNAIREAGVHVIGTIRDLREVAISLYRFKRAQVRPLLPGDHLLDSLDTRMSFLVFLVQAAERELPSLMNQTRLILTDECCLLRFEEMTTGLLNQRTRDSLDAIEPGLAADFAEVLPATLGRPTSTYSGRLSVASEYAWPEVEKLYNTIGYLKANRDAGYQ